MACRILFEQDAAPDADSVSGRICFYTSDSDDTGADEVITKRMTIDSAGNITMGTESTFNERLCVETNVASNSVVKFINQGNNANRHGIRVQCGLDSPGSDNDIRWLFMEDGDGTDVAFLQYKHSSTTAEIVAASDERMKENIADTQVNGLDSINSIRFREFNWTANSGRATDKKPIGVIAQEVEAAGDKCDIITPYLDSKTLVDGTVITDVKGAGKENLIYYMAKAIQELSAKVTALENA